jgi:signal transduction histidine kinase
MIPRKGLPVTRLGVSDKSSYNVNTSEIALNMAPVHVSSRLKFLLPVAGVLVIGLFVFLGVTLTLHPEARQVVILVAAAGAVAVCAVVLIVWAVLIQRPMMEMKDKMARLRNGDMSVSVNFAAQQDEIGELGRNFNETVRQLRESREEIQRLYRTQMTRAEHLATLGELAAGLAHEIRNPLAGIAGVIDIIGRDLPESSPGRQVLQEVQQEILRIKNILSDLLDYARPKKPEFHEADLNLTAERAVSLARQQVLSRPIQIELIKDNALNSVAHDPAQIQQVLLNLLLNGIQALDGKGQVRVELSSGHGCALLRVKDTGKGIPPEKLANLFRPFYTTKGGGTGLGLSLSRRIVESHEGAIEVASTPGEGTEFTVRLPMRKVPLKEAAS